MPCRLVALLCRGQETKKKKKLNKYPQSKGTRDTITIKASHDLKSGF